MRCPLLIGRCSDWVRYFWRGILHALDWVGFKYFKPMLIQSTVKQGLLPVCSVVPSCLLIKKPSLYLQVNMWKCLLICCYAFSTVSCILANVKRTDAIGQPTTTGGYNCYMPLDFSQILNAVVSLNMFCGFILITYYG